MTPSRRSFIRGLAALVVLPKLPVVEAAEQPFVVKKLGGPKACFDPCGYVGDFKWANITLGPTRVIQTNVSIREQLSKQCLK